MPESGDKAKTLSALEYAADQGHLAAQWKVGRMYAAGDGVPKDDQRAFIYFSQIANTHPDEPPGTAQARIVANAFVALGHYYLKGIPTRPLRRMRFARGICLPTPHPISATPTRSISSDAFISTVRRATRARRRAGSSLPRRKAIAAPRRCWATCCSRASTCHGKRRAA